MDEEEEEGFEDENEHLEEESEPDSDTEESRCDELEEFRNADVDCFWGYTLY